MSTGSTEIFTISSQTMRMVETIIRYNLTGDGSQRQDPACYISLVGEGRGLGPHKTKLNIDPSCRDNWRLETVTVFVVLIETPTIWFMAGCLGPGLSPPIMRVVRWWPVQFSLSNEMLRCWLLFLHLLTHWHSLPAPPVPPAIICKLSTQLNLINIKFM